MTKEREALKLALIKWTLGGEKDCCYDNWLGETPFGKILITWKGWKDYPCATVDEFPGEFQAQGSDPDAVKAECEAEFARRCKEALAQPEPLFTKLIAKHEGLAEELAQPERPQNCGSGFCSCIECVMEPLTKQDWKVYLLIGLSCSPIYLTSPKIKAIYANRKEAKAEANRLNNSPCTSKTYWVEGMKVKELNHD
jgi:hypothetical protein